MPRDPATSRRRVLLGIASATTVGALAGCSGDGDGGDGGGDGDSDGGDGGDTDTEEPTETPTPTATQQTEEVLVGPDTQNVFDPDSLEVPAGTEVTFVWESGGHSLVVDSQPDGASWEGVEETQSTGYEHSHTFDVAGTYEYNCGNHASFGMEGTITVTEG